MRLEIALQQLRRNAASNDAITERLARALGALLPPCIAQVAAIELVSAPHAKTALLRTIRARRRARTSDGSR